MLYSRCICSRLCLRSDHEQEVRFEGRLHRSWKRWKLSPMDLYARSKWTEVRRNTH